MGPFVQVVLGQIISLFGNAALRFVLPLILLRQTGSAAVYGAATALALLPALAGTLAGGVLADRCRKARLMVVLDLAAAGLALGAAASADDLPVVLWAPAALCALYALQGLYQPVVRASLPLLRTGDRLVQGNVFGTYLHGLFDTGELTEKLTAFLCKKKGISPADAPLLSMEQYRQQQFDLLADGVRAALDMDAVYAAMGMDRKGGNRV